MPRRRKRKGVSNDPTDCKRKRKDASVSGFHPDCVNEAPTKFIPGDLVLCPLQNGVYWPGFILDILDSHDGKVTIAYFDERERNKNIKEIYDVSFIADAANAILTAMEDSSVNVRMKAAWSMANMCDALALNRENGDLDFVDEFSDMLLLKLLTVATKSSQDSDKVKSNAVRAVGNLLRYLTERSLGKQNFVNAVGESVNALVKNVLSGTMKVRWNACYAVSNMFKNNLLPHGNAQWTIEVMNALSTVVKDCKNFKVRINAALALSVPRERSAYGSPELFAAVWDSLIVAIKSTEDISDFAEFRYRDNLTEQIVEAVYHMLELAGVDDMLPLLPCLQSRGCVLQNHMDKLVAAQSPFVKGSTLKKARGQMEALEGQASTGEELVCLKLLQDLCMVTQDVDEEGEMKPAEKSAFVQIYD